MGFPPAPVLLPVPGTAADAGAIAGSSSSAAAFCRGAYLDICSFSKGRLDYPAVWLYRNPRWEIDEIFLDRIKE